MLRIIIIKNERDFSTLTRKDFLLVTAIFTEVSVENSLRTNNLNLFFKFFLFLFVFLFVAAARDKTTERYSSCQRTVSGKI